MKKNAFEVREVMKKMESKESIFRAIKNEFSKKRILVLGDLMVDEYAIGNVKRISPEAPVPILNFKEKKSCAGGAANVAANLNSLGCKAFVSGVAADDSAGAWIRKRLSDCGIGIEGIVQDEKRPTTVKTRFLAKSQQLLRVDSEEASPIGVQARNSILRYLKKNLAEFDAVILSDYKKGVLDSGSFVREIIKICNEGGVQISVDSKTRDISRFENADFVKPNNFELEDAVGIKIACEKNLDKAGRAYLLKSKAKCLVVTRGSAGISVFLPGQKRMDFSSKALQVFDVTGAGDTVISVISLSLVSGLCMEDAVRAANFAASVVISKTGTASVSQEELLRRMDEE